MTSLLLDQATWQSAAEAHFAAVRRWTGPWRERRARQQKHPVEDFLFTYYSLPLIQLERWTPGIGTVLEWKGRDDEWQSFFPEKFFSRTRVGLFADPEKLSSAKRDSLGWIRSLLEKTAERPANFSCFGMHEWAMVDQGHEIRHEASLSLRLPQEEIDHFNRSRPVVCSHFDAFRFFPSSARPLNRLQPSVDTRHELEQPGCLHANMDLYKWAAKALPFVSSDLLRKCFELALDIRELDMRASPYDLSPYGYEPICIETAEGRKSYETQQRQLSERAKPLRLELIQCLDRVLQCVYP